MFAVAVFLVYMACRSSAAYENVYGPLYAREWLLMTDEQGYPHFVNFTALPDAPAGAADTRSFFLTDIYYYLYTRNNSDEPELLTVENNTVESRYLDPSHDLKVITHGWMSGGDADWVAEIKDAYLSSRDINVVAVDWGNLARNPFYPWAALSTRHVGRRLARLLDALAARGLPGRRVHLVGHSLGAQVMGYAGSFAKDNISRITGLDPARPLFELPEMGGGARLERGDAQFVDIVHTCGGVLGYRDSAGHADFYPNEGTPAQPGCEGLQYMMEACSHGRSYRYYMESIAGGAGVFRARRCAGCDEYRRGQCAAADNVMGEHADPGKHGDYYLETNSQSKFDKNE